MATYFNLIDFRLSWIISFLSENKVNLIFRFESSSDESDECDDKTVEDVSKDVTVQKQHDGNCLYFHCGLKTFWGRMCWC